MAATALARTESALALRTAFARAALHYWLDIFPRVRRETRAWRRIASRIPDPALRELALDAHRNETAKAEGAGFFAILAPRGDRATLVRAQVAFATLFDYVDTLAEQPSEDPMTNNRQLHEGMLVALRDGIPHADYYAHQPSRNDGGYLRALVEGWGQAFSALPSYPAVAANARRLAEQIVRYQTLILPERSGGHEHMREWARSESQPNSGLHWWEQAAGSSYMLGMLALMSAAAHPDLTVDESGATCDAYTLWVEAVCTLLDSAADETEDEAAGRRSLLSYYESPEQAATRLQMIATNAARALSSLPNGEMHLVVFAGLLANYLTPPPSTPMGHAIAGPVLETAGVLAGPAVAVFRLRRALARVADTLRSDPTCAVPSDIPHRGSKGAISARRPTVASPQGCVQGAQRRPRGPGS
jgi:tetraprenyl-beta-curcumene synthase